jgi:hypothetical protein
LLAPDGLLNVDYYMIIDTNAGEALVFEQFGSEGAGPQPPPGAPTWSYVTCGSSQPSFPAQVHTFVKVSDNVEDGRALLSASTGLTFNNPPPFVLSDAWQQLVNAQYFDDPNRSLAYAGALFKPFTVQSVPYGTGSLITVDMMGEYRGSGQTVLQFTPGVPIHGHETGSFLGVTVLPSDSLARLGAKGRLRAHQSTSSGDYLVASPGLGGVWGVLKDIIDSLVPYSFSYDKVVIGPLATTATPSSTSVPTGKKHIPRTGQKHHRSGE